MRLGLHRHLRMIRQDFSLAMPCSTGACAAASARLTVFPVGEFLQRPAFDAGGQPPAGGLVGEIGTVGTPWRSRIRMIQYLTDHAGKLLFAYREPQLPDSAVRYSSSAHGVWLSEQAEEQKLTALQNLTQHCHTLFCDSLVYARQRVCSWTELERLTDELETPMSPSS
jgi:hypothetical protein